MQYRKLGKSDLKISEISLGTWQVGGVWGSDFDEKNAEAILHKAIDLGINFIDTADVYSNGLSEKVVSKVIKSRTENIIVATKCGRRLSPHTADGYNKKSITHFVEDSLRNMSIDTIDLIQLHCPPTEVYAKDEVFETLEQLKASGKIRFYGASVEKVEEAMKAITYPHLVSIQIIFNMFRLKPAEVFFDAAKQSDVGIIVRVPLASGLLSGNYTKNTHFGEKDHRTFNREGKFFDKGETFSGIPFEAGLEAVEELKNIFGGDYTLATYALRWVLMFEQVSCVIPGASSPHQVEKNVAATLLSPLSNEQMHAVKDIYDKYFRTSIHQLW